MRFLAFSNVWMAIAALSQVLLSLFLNEQSINYFIAGFIFCSTLFVYNFLRIIKLKNISPENHSEQLIWVGRHLKIITWLLILSFFSTITLFLFLSHHLQLLILLSGFFAIGYNLPINKNGNTLRNIPYLKSVWISLIWAMATFIIPISENEFQFPVLEFIIRFLFIYVISIPFDIRDLKFDDIKMKTIPQVLGKTGAVFLGLILLATCLCLAFEIYDTKTALHFAISFLLTGIVLLFSIKERKEIFYPMVVDGMIVVQAVLVVGWIVFKI